MSAADWLCAGGVRANGVLAVDMDITEMYDLERGISSCDKRLDIGRCGLGKGDFVWVDIGGLAESQEGITKLACSLSEWVDVPEIVSNGGSLLPNRTLADIAVNNTSYIDGFADCDEGSGEGPVSEVRESFEGNEESVTACTGSSVLYSIDNVFHQPCSSECGSRDDDGEVNVKCLKSAHDDVLNSRANDQRLLYI